MKGVAFRNGRPCWKLETALTCCTQIWRSYLYRNLFLRFYLRQPIDTEVATKEWKTKLSAICLWMNTRNEVRLLKRCGELILRVVGVNYKVEAKSISTVYKKVFEKIFEISELGVNCNDFTQCADFNCFKVEILIKIYFETFSRVKEKIKCCFIFYIPTSKSQHDFC